MTDLSILDRFERLSVWNWHSVKRLNNLCTVKPVLRVGANFLMQQIFCSVVSCAIFFLIYTFSAVTFVLHVCFLSLCLHGFFVSPPSPESLYHFSNSPSLSSTILSGHPLLSCHLPKSWYALRTLYWNCFRQLHCIKWPWVTIKCWWPHAWPLTVVIQVFTVYHVLIDSTMLRSW